MTQLFCLQYGFVSHVASAASVTGRNMQWAAAAKIWAEKENRYQYFLISADNIIKGTKDTVEICIQGGIDAVNGFFDFMVYPVQVVPRISGAKREKSSSKRRQYDSSKAASFAAVLEKAAEDQPVCCYTVTYNADRELQTCFYQPSREYTL